MGLNFPVVRRSREFNRFGATADEGSGEGDHSAVLPGALLIRRVASRCRQSGGRGGASLQPPQNEAMQRQGQRNGEGGHHDQRIG
jgi:hypothetical protein